MTYINFFNASSCNRKSNSSINIKALLSAFNIDSKLLLKDDEHKSESIVSLEHQLFHNFSIHFQSLPHLYDKLNLH